MTRSYTAELVVTLPPFRAGSVTNANEILADYIDALAQVAGDMAHLAGAAVEYPQVTSRLIHVGGEQ